MKRCQFNFNNEVDSFPILVDEESGRVSIPESEDSTEVIAEYESVEQLAETYALARDVKPGNLKNWVLLENGDVYSYVLRAGTAGVSVGEVEEELEAAFANLNGYHPLSVRRAKDQIMSDGGTELEDALVHCTETEIARDIYDAMSVVINGTEEAEAADAPAEEVDTRTELEKYLDEMETVPGAYDFFAMVVGLEGDFDKAALLEALSNNFAFSNPDTLSAAYRNAINDAYNNGIGVDSNLDAMMIILQKALGTKDEETKKRIVVATRMAGRNKMNVAVKIVGQQHIRQTAEMVTLDEIENTDLFVNDNVPYIVRFSNTIDAELEAERNAAAAAEDTPDDSYEEDEEY